MNYKKLISQLESLRQNSQSFITDESEPIWQEDVEALDEAMDIIVDYEKVTEQLSMMMRKYETVKDAIGRGAGIYQCPDCSGTVNYGNEHCRWCGRRLGWTPRARRQEEKKQGGKRCRRR